MIGRWQTFARGLSVELAARAVKLALIGGIVIGGVSVASSAVQAEMHDAFLELGGLDERLPTREDTHFYFLASTRWRFCALAATGVVMTADDARGRLTERFPGFSRVYEEATVRMYADLLARDLAFDELQRAELKRRLAAGRWRLGRCRLASGSWLAGAQQMILSVGAAPGEFARRVLARVAPRAGRASSHP